MIVNGIPTRAGRIACVAMVCLLPCLLAMSAYAQGSTVGAQQADLDTVAAKVARELEAKKAKRVAVFDFVGPGHDLTALGQKLSYDFSAALARSSGKVHVEDRSRIAADIKKFDYRLSDVEDPQLGDALLTYLGVPVAVLGVITREGNEFTVSVRATRAGNNGANFILEHFGLPASVDGTKLAETIVERGEVFAMPATNIAVPNSGTHGYSYPACLYCPQAQFTDLAVQMNLRQATVILIGTITPDGRAADIRIVKHAPAGLAEKAVEAVQTWKFRPANGPDGKPAAVRQIIEVTFRLG